MIPKKTKVVEETNQETEPKEEEEVKEIEDIEREIDEKTTKRKGLLSRIIDLFTFTYDEFEEDYFSEEDIKEELKKVIKIQHKWINKLGPEKIKEFKNSEDFFEYKEILEKYNLIKK